MVRASSVPREQQLRNGWLDVLGTTDSFLFAPAAPRAALLQPSSRKKVVTADARLAALPQLPSTGS
jgi:hypothetical protein